MCKRFSLFSFSFSRSLSFQTPPDAVRYATVLAEYAQGLSVDWYPIKCTLRWDTYGIYAWELVSPFLMCLLPVLYIWASGPLHRFVDDKVAQIKYWARFTPEERMVKKDNAASSAHRLICTVFALRMDSS